MSTKRFTSGTSKRSGVKLHTRLIHLASGKELANLNLHKKNFHHLPLDIHMRSSVPANFDLSINP